MKHKVPAKADVVIIGGGVNGCSLAYQLAKKQLNVVVCERSYLCSGATGRCGAGIRQQWTTKENTELAMQSVKIFETLGKELNADIGLRQGGYLVVIHDNKEMKQAEQRVAMQHELGLDVSLVDSAGIQQIAPILDVQGMQAIGATFCSTDGHADPFKTTYAYAENAEQLGASICKNTEVTHIESKHNQITKVHTNNGSIRTDTVVNAAGAWSIKLAEDLGVHLPNQPLRKEIFVSERIQPLFETMVISFRDGIYFSQVHEGQILGGIPNPNEQPGFNTQSTQYFLERMCTTLARYAPIFQQVKVIRQWTGYYDVTPDARPIIGEVPHIKGFLQCNGFSGHGFMLSPMVTKILTDFIAEGKHHPLLDQLSINRFTGKKLEHEGAVVG